MSSHAPKRLKVGLPATYVEGFHDKKAVQDMVYRPLGGETNLDVSALSFGASSLGSVFHETNLEESIEVVHHAIKSGINWIDTAPWYGHGKSEEVLGKALKGVPREAYYISTKVGRYLPDTLEMFDFSAERVTRSVDESLARLGIDYIDVIQIHDPEFAPSIDIIINETLPALIKVKESGKVKMVGMTGYPMAFQREIVEKFPGKLDTVLSYCHYSMNDYSLINDLEWLKEHKLGLINASAISMGLLTNRDPPQWHPATPLIREKCIEAKKYCQSHGVDISTLAMAFTLSNTAIPTTLVSTASLERLKKNIASVTYTLTEKEQEVSKYIMETFFAPLQGGQEHWEGVEVAAYWQKVGKKFMLKTRYPNFVKK